MKTLQERIAEVPYWYHSIELPGGITTPGWAPLSAVHYRVPLDLRGKRVLDIGTWDGYWAFEALKRGAREVVAIDDFSDIANFMDLKKCPPWFTFDLCREALGYTEDQCKRIEMSVYDVANGELGRFDIVFCFGVIYHCRYPLLALDRISMVCDESLYVESATLDYYSAYQGGDVTARTYEDNHVVMEFYPGAQYAGGATNWWVPTLKCLAQMVRSAGFENVYAWPMTKTPDLLAKCRGFIRGDK